MKHKLILGSLMLLLNMACKQKVETSNKLNQKEMISEIKTTVKNYKNYPNYSIQLDKGGCKVELIGNDMPLLNAFDEGGFSSLIPFNANILQSGKQKVKIRIYPAGGKTTFDDYTRVTLGVYFFPNDKSPNPEKSVLAQFEIPKEAIEKKLSIFEAEIEFDAQVPFDFSEDLKNAQQLDKMPDIEQKVLASYSKIRDWLQKGDTSNIADFRRNSDGKLAKVFYYDTDSSLNELFDYTFLHDDNKKLDPLPKYNMVFYANGKLVRLERIDNKDEVITLTGKTSDGYETTSDLSVLLYLPKGATALVQY